MKRHAWIKLFRYGVLFPLDVCRGLPCFVAAILVAPLRPFLSRASSTRLTAQVVLLLFLWRRAEPALVDAFATLIGKASTGIFRTVLGFFQWPASRESGVLGFCSIEAHHRARLHLVKTSLPAGRVVLDLGGSGGGIPEGGLLFMGYPHAPDQVTIVDLPPETQFWKHDAPAAATYSRGATTVRYHYSGMNDLSAFADGSVDGAWGGQCIEHVPRKVALATMAEIFRVLKPGGWFCLDTPNRGLTHLLVRVGFIHPEHFAEYFPSELAVLLQRTGFAIGRSLAVSAMPLSRRVGRFWKYEVKFGEPMGDDPADGYSFFIEARKPD